jgi:hypothetical protein
METCSKNEFKYWLMRRNCARKGQEFGGVLYLCVGLYLAIMHTWRKCIFVYSAS